MKKSLLIEKEERPLTKLQSG